ncbi:MAG: hypothetical protein ACP6KW_05970 [Candidatus Thorarchaeota archaeon]
MATLRDILCASLSLDDGLSKIQNISFRNSDEGDLLFDVARAIEEIILRRPGLASAKLTELTVRLSFKENRTLPELLMLLDTRYTNSYKRSECELLPDIDAIPRLIDILGDLIQAVTSSIRLNLRPVLPFLTDEALLTLNSLHDRRLDSVTQTVVHEVHYLAWILIDAGFFEGAELLLNRLIEVCSELNMHDLTYEVTFDHACVLTELKMFDTAREVLNRLEQDARAKQDTLRLAEVTLQLAVNETRDDSISHEVARKLADRAAELYDMALKSGLVSKDQVGLAHLVIGSSILANGWREAVPEVVSRLEMGLKIYESCDNTTSQQKLHVFRTLAGLGFAHGLMGDHENMKEAVTYFHRGLGVLEETGSDLFDTDIEIARAQNALGWLCLGTESDEFWDLGLEAFEQAERMRTELWKKGRVSDIELIGTRMGMALSKMRSAGRSNEQTEAPVRDILVQYVPLFPTDTRAYIEIAISTYNVVWLISRHGGTIPARLQRLLEDIDRMLVDAPDVDDRIFIEGVSLVVPYLSESWSTLLERSKRMAGSSSGLSEVAVLSAALSAAKLNIDALNLEIGGRVMPTVDDEVTRVDPLLAQYWLGQTYLTQTIRDFYENKDYSDLATGLYGSAIAFGEVTELDPDFGESSEFITATAASLSQVLRRFALALENQYAAYIDRSQFDSVPPSVDESQYSLVLVEDWLGLIKIANAYLEMVEQSEMVEAQPYLNAVFANVNRALRMMDSVSMVDRRVLALLGSVMNERFYLRM